jgi:hypothetical protein
MRPISEQRQRTQRSRNDAKCTSGQQRHGIGWPRPPRRRPRALLSMPRLRRRGSCFGGATRICAQKVDLVEPASPDPRYAGIRVDAHFFHDDIAPREREAADRLIELAESMLVSMAIPHTVRAELDHPNTPPEARLRASRLSYTMDTGEGDRARLNRAKAVMQGNAQPGKHHKDAAHLYDVALWHCSYFVTCDERILRKQAELREAVGDLWVVRPTELLAIYDDYDRRQPRDD